MQTFILALYVKKFFFYNLSKFFKVYYFNYKSIKFIYNIYGISQNFNILS